MHPCFPCCALKAQSTRDVACVTHWLSSHWISAHSSISGYTHEHLWLLTTRQPPTHASTGRGQVLAFWRGDLGLDAIHQGGWVGMSGVPRSFGSTQVELFRIRATSAHEMSLTANVLPLHCHATAEFRPISITKQAGKPASKPKPPTKDLPESASFFSQQGGGTQRNPEPGSTSGRTGSSSQAPLNYSQGGSDCDGDGDSGVGLESQFAGLQSQTQQLLRCLDGNRDAQAEGRGEGDAGPEAALPWRYAVKLERLAGRNPQVGQLVCLLD